MITVLDIDETNFNDVFKVCSSKHLNDPTFKKGIELKQRWIKENLTKYGPFIKIAYYNKTPAAQIMYYPETAIPYYKYPRQRVIEIFCAYRSIDDAKGAGTILLKNLIDEAKKGIKCLEDEPCSFLVASPFNTGEGTSLREYYLNNGFQESESELYRELTGKYYPRKKETYENPFKDKGKAIIFYDMNCEYGWVFSLNIEKILRDIDHSLEIIKINKWNNPTESIKRGNPTVTVNGVTIKSGWRTPEFQSEVKKALNM